MFAWIAQTTAVTLMNLRNIPSRMSSTLVAVIGIAGVVMVTVGVFSIATGLSQSIADTSNPATVVVLRAAATGEMDSGITNEEAKILTDIEGIARDDEGVLISPELFVVVDVPRKSTGTGSNVPLRGVDGARAFAVRGGVEIKEGRMFEPGVNEIIVGEGAAAQFEGIALGDSVRWGRNEWRVVGIMDSGGGIPDSEIWTDAKVLQGAYRRGSNFSVVRVKLDDPARFNEFKDRLTSDPRLNVKAITESQFYSERTQALRNFTSIIGVAVGALMALGAVFTALNTMYSAVSARTREIGTLRAMGFSSGPVIVSVLLEALALGLLGGLVGGVLAWLIFNGLQVATLNYQTFSQVTFSFAVTSTLLVGGILFALAMGFFGGVIPAIRAALMPITSALREL